MLNGPRSGCKRILISNDYYPALAAPNVEVVPAGLREVRGSTVVASDGSERVVDAIVFGTGFHVADMPIASRITGLNGRTLGRSGRTAQARCAAPPCTASRTCSW